MRLGKKPARIDANRLKLRNYLPAALPVPASADWTLKVPTWGMMLNDMEGDCVFAGGGHAVQTWTAAQGVDRTPPDCQVQYYYEQWAGYDPARPSTNQGYIEIDFLPAMDHDRGHAGSRRPRALGSGLQQGLALPNHMGQEAAYGMGLPRFLDG